jgi:hypothetical protein
MPLAVITFLDGSGRPVDPNYGVGAPVYPSQGLPGSPVYPSGQPILPPGGATLPVFPFDPTIDNSLPNAPVRPGNELPGSGGRPDNSLPGGGNRPDTMPIRPGAKFVVKWLACVGLILVPDNSLPSGSGRPDQTLPPTPEPKSPK